MSGNVSKALNFVVINHRFEAPLSQTLYCGPWCYCLLTNTLIQKCTGPPLRTERIRHLVVELHNSMGNTLCLTRL